MASSMADLLWSDETELNSREHLGDLVSVKVYRLLEYSVRIRWLRNMDRRERMSFSAVRGWRRGKA